MQLPHRPQPMTVVLILFSFLKNTFCSNKSLRPRFAAFRAELTGVFCAAFAWGRSLLFFVFFCLCFSTRDGIMTVSLDKANGVQWFFRLNSVLIGFVALRSEYASILRSGRRAAKKRCLPKIFDLKREDFFVLEVEERSNTVVLRVMRQTKRGNIPFQEPSYPDCFV